MVFVAVLTAADNTIWQLGPSLHAKLLRLDDKPFHEGFAQMQLYYHQWRWVTTPKKWFNLILVRALVLFKIN